MSRRRRPFCDGKRPKTTHCAKHDTRNEPIPIPLERNTRGFEPSTTAITDGRGCCDYHKFYGNVVVVVIVTDGRVTSGVIIPRSLVGKEEIKKKSYQSAVASMIRERARARASVLIARAFRDKRPSIRR